MAGITLTKISNLLDENSNGLANVGETIKYTLTITNTAAAPLSDIAINDPKLSSTPIPVATTLSPGQSTTVEVDYILTAADIDLGQVDTTTEVTGTAGGNAASSGPISDSEALAQTSVINLTKTLNNNQSYQDANGNGRPDVGEITQYNYTVTNSGNTSLFNVTLRDLGLPSDPNDTVIVPLIGLSDLDGDGQADDLSAGTTATGSYNYVLTQATLDTGTFLGTAETEGMPPGSDLALPASGSVLVNLPQRPNFEIVKTAGTLRDAADGGEFTDLDGNGIDAGDLVNYRYTFTNTGNVTLNTVTLVDDNGTPGDTSDDVAIALDQTTLLPGETATGSYQQVLTQATIDTGTLTNIVTGTAKDPKNRQLAPQQDTETVAIAGEAAFTLLKTAGTVPDAADAGEFTDVDGNGIDAGDWVNYSYAFTNMGAVTLSNVALIDDNGTPADTSDDVTIVLDQTTLAPGEMATGTYQRELTQADIDAGSLTNIVTGTAEDPNDDPLPPKTDEETVVVEGTPAFTLLKTAGTVPDAADAGEFTDVDGNGIDAGDLVNYSYTFTNTGAVTLSNVALIDDNGTPTDTSDDVTIVLDQTTLAPGESATGTYQRELTQADIDAGSLTNIVTGTAEDPNGNPLLPQTDEETVSIVGTPDFAIAKTAGTVKDAADPGEFTDVDGNGIDAGDLVNYSYTFTNTGSVTLNNVELVDDNGTPADTSDDVVVTLDKTTLTPGEVATGTYQHELTQADIDAGSLTNIVTGTAEDPDGNVLTPKTDEETVTLAKPPAIELVKTAGAITDTNHDCFVAAGDEVTYTYVVTNSGPVDLFNLVLTDDNGTPADPLDDFEVRLTTGLSDLDGDGAVDDLASGGSANGTYVKTLSQADFDGGTFTNIGTVTGEGPQGQPVEATDPETIDLSTAGAAILLEKNGHLDVGADCVVTPGDVVTFTFKVTNSGARGFDGVAIADNIPGLSPIQWQSALPLNPGESRWGTATYAITAEDIAWGRVVNVATVYGNVIGNDLGDRSDDLVDIDNTWIEFPQDLIPANAGDAVPLIAGDASANTLVGTATADTIAGGFGDDKILGGDGDDILRGDENQSLPGGPTGGDDFIDGGAGNDRIGGKGGNDTLLGGVGDDLIWGGLGDDILRGGAGNDQLTGGTGSDPDGQDLFILAAGEGFDWITDFEVGTDHIGLANGLTLGQLTLVQSNGDTLIRLGQENLALLQGVTATGLGASDFLTL